MPLRSVRRAMIRMLRRPLQLLTVAMVIAVVSEPPLGRADIIFQVPEVLVRHAAVTKPVGTGKPNPAPNASEPWPDPVHVQERFEYFVEHAVSTSDAKKMAMMLKVSQIPETTPGCGKCSQRELDYCETKMLADHCCCERHFIPEPFPWLPHTCYIGPERCTPLAKNCAHYARLRDCCCMKKLAQHWKGILSQSSSIGASGFSVIVISMIIFTIYL